MFGMTKTAMPVRPWIPATFRHQCVGRYCKRSFDWALTSSTTPNTLILSCWSIGLIIGRCVIGHPLLPFVQHDGAPPHFAGAVRGHLNQCFGRRWIGRDDPITWPPRSSDLTALDFFLWGHMKSLVYQAPLATVGNLLARVMIAAKKIQQIPGVMERVCQNRSCSYNVCNEFGGRHIEPLL